MNNDLYSKIEREFLSPRSLLTLGAVGILLLILLLVSTNTNDRSRVDPIKQPVVIDSVPYPFDGITLTARAAIVWDIKHNREIFSRESTTVLPLASLTKLVTAIAAVETVPEYTVVPIEAEALAQEGDSGLLLHERWNLRELIKTSLISSSNDGARAIASVVGAVLTDHTLPSQETQPMVAATDQFVQKMNQFTARIGMADTHFNNEHGLDVSTIESGGYGTARDMATLLSYAWNHHADILDSTATRQVTTRSIDGIDHVVKNTNPVVENIPGILASKTGFTDLAGGNVVVLTSPGLEGPFAIVVLGSTYDGRFEDLSTLSKATLEYIVKNR